MSSGIVRVRLLLGGAALAALGLVSSACSDEASNAASTEGAAVSTTTSSLAAGTTTPATAPATTVVATVDPTALLQQGVATLGTTYHFRSSVVVNGAETLLAEGDRVGDGSRLDLTSGGATVGYVITPAGSWAQPEGGDWELLDVPPATADPILALGAPSAIGVLSDDGTTVRLRVTVSAATLGVGTEGTADVEVVITAGVISEVDYSTATPDGVASVATIFGPVVDPTPVVPPI
jgi:hypothetical protein